MFQEVRYWHAHFDLYPTSTVPEVARWKICHVFRQNDRKVFTTPLHQEGSDCVVLVAGQVECICLIGQAIVEALEGNLLILTLCILKRLHYLKDLMWVDFALELSDHNDEAREGWISRKLWAFGALLSITRVLHNDSLTEGISWSTPKEIYSLLVRQVKVVISGASDLDRVQSVLNFEGLE